MLQPYSLLELVSPLGLVVGFPADLAVGLGKLYSRGIFLNLCKAFDTVDHNILLAKLEHYEIRGLQNEWFCSYLTNRQQFISVNNSDSDPLQITCGVPQGSVLGPVLFLIYINDFTSCSSIFDFHLFADDTNLPIVIYSILSKMLIENSVKLAYGFVPSNYFSILLKHTL